MRALRSGLKGLGASSGLMKAFSGSLTNLGLECIFAFRVYLVLGDLGGLLVQGSTAGPSKPRKTPT